ncbi:MAG: hypothetical protein H7838_00340 [Magnetococcus sp. DMHC-8]
MIIVSSSRLSDSASLPAAHAAKAAAKTGCGFSACLPAAHAAKAAAKTGCGFFENQQQQQQQNPRALPWTRQGR